MLSVLARRFASVVAAALVAACCLIAAPVAPAGAVTGPQLNTLSISPTTATISSSAATVTVQMRIVDSASPLASGCLDFDKPNTTLEYTGECFNASNLIGGSLNNGLFQVTLTIRQYAHTGFYPVGAVTLQDVAGAKTVISGQGLALGGFPDGVNVAGTSDTTPPALVSVSLSSHTGDLANGPFTATVTAQVSDDLSGYVGDCIDFGSPTGLPGFGTSACLIEPQDRISGTPQAGTYQSTLTIPQAAAPGVYPLLDYHLQDDAGNFVNLTPAQIESAGAPAAITVTNSDDTAPGPPTNVSATAGNASATVSWTAPTSNGGAELTGYTMTATPGGNTATVSGGTTTATVTGLTNSTAYTFTVHATNGIGSSAESAPSSAVTPESSPEAPTAVTATGGTGQVSVTWTPPASDGGSPITGYTLTASPGGETATAGAAATGATVTGLFNGTAYTVTLHATNAIGDGPESAPSNTATTTPGVSTPPQSLSATGGNKQANLQWGVPVNNGGTPIISYTATATPGGESVTVPATSSSPQGAILTGLSNAVTYTFTVHATNSSGNSAESAPSGSVKTSGPADAPTNLRATAGNGRATLTWSAPFNEGSAITNYVVTASPGGKVEGVAPPKTSITFTGLTNGTTYSFTVSASNGSGAGKVSVSSNRVTPVDPPTAPSRPVAPSVAPGPASGAIGSLRVTYVAPAANRSAITKFTATCTSGNFGVTRSASHVGSTAVAIVVANVTMEKTYRCTVIARNAVGASPASPASAAVIVGTPAPTAPPTVTRIASGSLKVRFNPPANNGGPINDYIVGCTSSNGGGPGSKTVIATVVVITNLWPGKTYTCTVKAINSRGTGPSSAPSSPVKA